jgi:hypothetical protein
LLACPSTQPPPRGFSFPPGSHGSHWEVQVRRGRPQQPYCACRCACIATDSDRCGYSGERHHLLVRHRHRTQQAGRADGNRPRDMGAGAGPPHDGTSTARRCVRQLWPRSLTVRPRPHEDLCNRVAGGCVGLNRTCAKPVRLARSPANVDQNVSYGVPAIGPGRPFAIIRQGGLLAMPWQKHKRTPAANFGGVPCLLLHCEG